MSDTKIKENNRIIGIKESPISWRERELLTAAEIHLFDGIDIPLVKYLVSCFPQLADSKNKQSLLKIDQVWNFQTAAYHLQKQAWKEAAALKTTLTATIPFKAARIYEQEAQRNLGGVFLSEHKFWETFYKRQRKENTKPMVAIDALYFLSNCQDQITHQLLIQAFKNIMEGYYQNFQGKKSCFENAKRLLLELPTPKLQTWLNQQLSNDNNLTEKIS